MINKKQFYAFCQTSETGPGNLSVKWRVEARGFDRVVFLYGLWGDGSIVERELYRPMPANQHKNFALAVSRCIEQAKKYQRWLEEYKASLGGSHVP